MKGMRQTVGRSLNSHVEFQQNHTRNSNNISPSSGCKYRWFQAHHSVLLLLFPRSHPPPTPSFARGWGVTVGSEVAPVSGFHHTVLSLHRKEGCWHRVKKDTCFFGCAEFSSPYPSLGSVQKDGSWTLLVASAPWNQSLSAEQRGPSLGAARPWQRGPHTDRLLLLVLLGETRSRKAAGFGAALLTSVKKGGLGFSVDTEFHLLISS